MESFEWHAFAAMFFSLLAKALELQTNAAVYPIGLQAKSTIRKKRFPTVFFFPLFLGLSTILPRSKAKADKY